MNNSAKWADLAPRVISGIVMAAAGAAEIWVGGVIFAATVACLSGIMVWEAARMFAADASAAVRVGLLGGGAFGLATIAPWLLVVPLLLAAAVVGSGQVAREKHLFVVFAAWILVGSFSMVVLRNEAGIAWLLWLVAVVVVSDIAGYFAGRTFGGPKFWPKISPKKTWSGTVAGWIGAALVGFMFTGPTNAGLALVPISMVVALAGQMGDILESAVKRRMDVKDSSNLIPGHGGVLDRLDAMLGAAMFVMVLWFLRFLPGLT